MREYACQIHLGWWLAYVRTLPAYTSFDLLCSVMLILAVAAAEL